jgi:hypothetical protein
MTVDFPEPGIPSILMIEGRWGMSSCEALPPVFSMIGVRGYSSSSLLSSMGYAAERPGIPMKFTLSTLATRDYLFEP